MGNYTDYDTINKFMPQFADQYSALYSSTADFVESAITEAEAVVDAHVGGRWSLPFSAVPPLIRKLATQIAIHQIYAQLYPGENASSNPYADRYERWNDNAFRMLEKLQEGKIVLTDTAGSLISPRSTGRMVTSNRGSYTPIADLDDISKWDIDPDLEDVIESARK